MVVAGVGRRRPQVRLTRLMVLITLGLVCVLAILLGVYIPSQWQVPVLLVAVCSLAIIVAIKFHKRLYKVKKRLLSGNVSISKQLSNVQSTVTRLETITHADMISFEKELQMLMMKVNAIEKRAHNDELRMREIGQLASKSASSSESILKHLDSWQTSKEESEKQVGRPKASNIIHADGPKKMGRLAAAVRPDANRDKKLLQAMEFPMRLAEQGEPYIATVGTPALSQHLSMSGYESLQLMPSTSAPQLVQAHPDILVLEEASFSDGPWYGTDSSGGATLFAEIEATCSAARKLGIQIFVIQNSRRPDIYTLKLRSMGDCSLPFNEAVDSWAIDADLGVVGELQNYAINSWSNK